MVLSGAFGARRQLGQQYVQVGFFDLLVLLGQHRVKPGSQDRPCPRHWILPVQERDGAFELVAVIAQLKGRSFSTTIIAHRGSRITYCSKVSPLASSSDAMLSPDLGNLIHRTVGANLPPGPFGTLGHWPEATGTP